MGRWEGSLSRLQLIGARRVVACVGAIVVEADWQGVLSALLASLVPTNHFGGAPRRVTLYIAWLERFRFAADQAAARWELPSAGAAGCRKSR